MDVETYAKVIVPLIMFQLPDHRVLFTS